MENLSLREKLHQYINNGDETLINMMWDMVANYDIKNINNINNNTSQSIEEYNKDIDESLEQFRKGEFITQKELEEQSEKW